MKIHASITFQCPDEKAWIAVSSSALEIFGECANDEYPANHVITVACLCGKEHVLDLTSAVL